MGHWPALGVRSKWIVQPAWIFPAHQCDSISLPRQLPTDHIFPPFHSALETAREWEWEREWEWWQRGRNKPPVRAIMHCKTPIVCPPDHALGASRPLRTALSREIKECGRTTSTMHMVGERGTRRGEGFSSSVFPPPSSTSRILRVEELSQDMVDEDIGLENGKWNWLQGPGSFLFLSRRKEWTLLILALLQPPHVLRGMLCHRRARDDALSHLRPPSLGS